MQEIAVALITSLSTLAAVALTASLARSKDYDAARREELVHCYAEFFQCYAAYIADSNTDRQGRVIYALEVAQLLLPADSAMLMKEFEHKFLHCPQKPGSRAKLLDEIRKQAVKDISHFYPADNGGNKKNKIWQPRKKSAHHS